MLQSRHEGVIMKNYQKNILIELRTVIDDEGDKELSIIKQKGKYYRKNDLEVITFIDEMTDVGRIDHFITIRAKKVNIKRTGNITMNQQFIPGRKTDSLYRHPYGSFHMEVFTKSIQYEPLSENKEGIVQIEYDATLNGEQVRKHHLTLIYTEEKQR